MKRKITYFWLTLLPDKSLHQLRLKKSMVVREHRGSRLMWNECGGITNTTHSCIISFQPTLELLSWRSPFLSRPPCRGARLCLKPIDRYYYLLTHCHLVVELHPTTTIYLGVVWDLAANWPKCFGFLTVPFWLSQWCWNQTSSVLQR